jgi:glycosyltransferase involved in cell wall biosynthesis
MDSNRLVNNKPSFSFLIPFRNREIERVKNCLKSISEQTLNDYEVIFIDYGSDEVISNEVEKLVLSFGFKYIFTDTRGMFWNQNHALNIGLKKGQNNYIIRLDIDIILPSFFLQKISAEIEPNNFINCKCRYATASFNLEQFTQEQLLKLPQSETVATGLCMIVSRQKLLEINGFDEYYILWGFDDLDTTKRLTGSGLKHHWIDASSLSLLHQWHPTHYNDRIKNLYKVKMKYYISNAENNHKIFGEITQSSDRSALSILKNLHTDHEIKINLPSQYSFISWNSSFLKLNTGDYQYLNFKHSYVSKNTSGSKLYNLVGALNKLLKSIKVSYRLVDLEKFQEEYISDDQIYDFILFFVINYKAFIRDYYFIERDDELLFAVVKS